ncbi:MAG: AIR carboxylase family protein [archaeon]|nr:AIR carboxylase family protein [archaeon]
MTDVFVVFGSKSDEAVYQSLLGKLDKAGISYEFKVLSAHKTPKELRSELSDTNAGIFIAGAGLSAALPGIVAAEKIKPVIGIPCDGAFSGLDAFLSVSQMPSNVPVLAVGVGKTSKVVRLCSNYVNGLNEIVLIKKTADIEKKYFDKCKAFMEENKIPFRVENNSTKLNHSKVYIEFTKLGKTPAKNRNAIIRVLVKDNSTKKDSLKFFESLQSSFSVGLNSYKNAAIVALELINLKGQHDGLLVSLRKKASQEVLDANK